MYQNEGWQKPLEIWWMLIPGINILVGLRQIHFLSEYWAKKQDQEILDPLVKQIPWLFKQSI